MRFDLSSSHHTGSYVNSVLTEIRKEAKRAADPTAKDKAKMKPDVSKFLEEAVERSSKLLPMTGVVLLYAQYNIPPMLVPPYFSTREQVRKTVSVVNQKLNKRDVTKFETLRHLRDRTDGM